MKIKKGTLLEVTHSRSGRWMGIATKAFDTIKDEWYSIALAQETAQGLNTEWHSGADMPARRGLCTVKVVKRIPKPAKDPVIATFGKDHWSTLAYFDTLVMDRQSIDKRRMRCNFFRHRELNVNGMEWSPKWGTILKGGKKLKDHDDWDCAEDMVKAGLIKRIPASLKVTFTEKGKGVMNLLRDHKAKGGNFAEFSI